MLPLQQQVTSKDLSQRLKALGVPQESYFYWWEDEIDIDESEWRLGVLSHNIDDEVEGLRGFDEYNWDIVHGTLEKWEDIKHEFIAAFSCSELGEMLPRILKLEGGKIGQLRIRKIERTKETDGWIVEYYDYIVGDYLAQNNLFADTFAEALGLMLEYLLKEGLITLEDN